MAVFEKSMRAARRLLQAISAAAFVCVLVGGPQCRAADGASADVPLAGDIYEMVASIAQSAASARIGGNDQSFEKIVTIGRNAAGAPVVTSMQVRTPEADPTVPEGTLALMIVHYVGQCAPPYGNDADGIRQGIAPFVVSPSGKNVWQVASVNDVPSMRLIKSASEFGAWESIQSAPAHYRTYPCGKYR